MSAASLVKRSTSGFAVSDAARAALQTYVDLVTTWNRQIDLTAARTPEELVDLLLADALVLGRLLSTSNITKPSVVDVGTGAGAPGLPLAVLRPDLRLTLVEPLQKRVSFLRTVHGTLGLLDLTLVRDRGEAVLARGETFDVAISRATLPPPEWLALGAKLAPGGTVAVLLARGEAPTLPGWRAAEPVAYSWPLTGNERSIVLYRPDEP